MILEGISGDTTLDETLLEDVTGIVYAGTSSQRLGAIRPPFK